MAALGTGCSCDSAAGAAVKSPLRLAHCVAALAAVKFVAALGLGCSAHSDAAAVKSSAALGAGCSCDSARAALKSSAALGLGCSSDSAGAAVKSSAALGLGCSCDSAGAAAKSGTALGLHYSLARGHFSGFEGTCEVFSRPPDPDPDRIIVKYCSSDTHTHMCNMASSGQQMLVLRLCCRLHHWTFASNDAQAQWKLSGASSSPDF